MKMLWIRALAVPMLLFSATGLSAQIILSPLDREFLTGAIRGDDAQIAMGRLATERAQSIAIRKFGQELINVRTNHRVQAAAMARLIDVAVDETPVQLAALAGLKGAAFDAAFKQQVVAGYQKEIASYEALVQNGKNLGIRALTQQTIPRLRKYLKLAQAL
jgi:putative membrane protein